MTAKENINKIFFEKGQSLAFELQKESMNLSGTALNEKNNIIPDFSAAIKNKNMLERKIGFVCKSSAGRIVRLIQPYDSTIYTQEPEELSAQWGFVWSTEPKHALPFIAIATSPYMKDDVCIENNKIYRALNDNLVHSPKEYPEGWTEVKEI